MWDQWHCKMMHTIFLITTIGHTRNIQNWGSANWVVLLEHGITAADQEEMRTIWRGCMRHNSWWLETRAQTSALHTMHDDGRMKLGGRRGRAGECLQESGQAEWCHGGYYQELHSDTFHVCRIIHEPSSSINWPGLKCQKSLLLFLINHHELIEAKQAGCKNSMEVVLTNVTARAVKQSQPTLDNLVYGQQQLGSYHPSPVTGQTRNVLCGCRCQTRIFALLCST